MGRQLLLLKNDRSRKIDFVGGDKDDWRRWWVASQQHDEAVEVEFSEKNRLICASENFSIFRRRLVKQLAVFFK